MVGFDLIGLILVDFACRLYVGYFGVVCFWFVGLSFAVSVG